MMYHEEGLSIYHEEGPSENTKRILKGRKLGGALMIYRRPHIS